MKKTTKRPKTTKTGRKAPATNGKSRSVGSPQIIVLGMHRSGTSALTGALSRMGVFVGDEEDLTGRNWENPEGFYERRDARTICDALLHGSGADWWKVSAFDPENVDHAAARTQRPHISNLIQALDASGRAWALKEPRLCFLLPVFRSALKRPFAIIAYRHPVEVARSLRRRNGFPIRVGLALWEAYTVAALRHGLELNHVIVNYDDLLDQASETLGRVKTALESAGARKLTLAPAVAGINPSLRRERLDNEEGMALLSASQQALWEQLQSRNLGENMPSVSVETLKTLREFETDEAERGRLRSDLQEVVKQLKETRAAVSDRDAQIAAYKEEHAALKSSKDAVQERLNISDKTLRERDAQIERLTAQQEKLQAELNRSREREGKASEGLANNRAKLIELERTHAGILAQLEIARGELDLANERGGDLKAERATLRERIEQLEGEISQIVGKRDELTDALQVQADELKESLRLTAQAEAARGALQSELDSLTREAATLREDIAAIEARSDQLRTELSASQEEARQAQKDRSTLEVAHDEVTDKAEALRKALADKSAEGEASKQELETVRSSLREAETRLQTALSERDEAATKADALWKALADKSAEGEASKRELETVRSSLRDAEARLQTAISERDEAAAKAVHVEQKTDALWGALADKSKAAEESKQELALVRKDLSDAETRLKGVSLERDLANAGLETARHETDALRGALADKSNAAEASRQELALVRKDLGDANLRLHFLDGQLTRRQGAIERVLEARRDRQPGNPFAGGLRRLASALRGKATPENLALRREALAASPLFEVYWYAQRNSDVKEAGNDAIGHYLAHGDAEGRDPHPLFRRAWYLEHRTGEIDARRTTALEAYLADPDGVSPHPLFDATAYAEAAGIPIQGALAHYLLKGVVDGIKPNPFFDPLWYLETYRDVARSGMEPLTHYAIVGATEGRRPGPYFSPRDYLAAYPDVRKSGEEPLAHYLSCGKTEGRSAGVSL